MDSLDSVFLLLVSMKYKYLEAMAASHLTFYGNGNPSAGTLPKHLFCI